jgi:hypothetical protein
MKLSLTRLLVFALMITPVLRAQFSSGSTGSDGALNVTTPGTFVFDPVALGLNPAGDNIFNFTTINIGANVMVVMTADVLRNRSVIWLATGNVTIAGVLNLSGASGSLYSGNNPGATRSPAMPGPGGFPGGVGAYLTSPATNGGGYGGGVTGTTSGGLGGYLNTSNQLVPLVGGSGGAGGQLGIGTAGGNGGAGGGAIRIVSSTSISVTGTINANGGTGGNGLNSYVGGQGSGGAIHLIAPTVTNSGIISAGNGSPEGVVKISANSSSNTGSIFSSVVVTGPLYNPPLPTAVPQVNVVSVNGIAAPADVTASYLLPDFTVSSMSAVSINISAQYVPVGTVVTLYLTSEQGNDSTVTCSALAGSLVSSTATCPGATFPQGVTITDIRAVW